MGGECIWGGLEFDMGCWGGGPSGRATTEHMYEEHERMRHTDSR